jgi:Tol biopolymer transport system component
MSLTPGKKLGPYEILSPLGAGGMGEVYRARDTRLGRDVAIKVLPAHLSASPEVRARFEREAKTVSALNHPNICTLFDVGREGQTDYLVMELIDGETLAARLQKGPLPPNDVLRVGSEIADALDQAHRAGVVHRDLKPGNVMLTKSGAKLMDFGLARATGLAGTGDGVTMASLTQSPTMGQPLTAEGTLVGTFQYMAPEQLEGKEATSSADIWAFGCVLYEMAAGRRAFEGKSQASLITSIMGAQPTPISQVSPMSPPALDQLVGACLTKDPGDRLQSAHDLKLQLSWIAQGGSQIAAPRPVVARRKSRERLAWIVAGVAIVAAGVAGFFATRSQPVPPPVHAFLQPPRGVLYSSSTDKPLPLAISPDGKTIAFCARAGEGPDQLWVRSLGEDDARALPGTEDAEGPFFSPDGRTVAFYADRKMRRVDVAGGPVIDIVEPVDPRGSSWNDDGVILFTMGASDPISYVSADGGPVEAASVLDTTQREATHRYPIFLPDGKHFLYLARRAGAGKGESPTIYAGDLESGQRTPVVEVASNVIYASGHVLYVRGTALVAQRFNSSTLQVEGPAVPLVDDVRMDERFSRGVFAASENGVLVCMTGNNQTRLQMRWLDRAGKAIGDVGEPADYTYGGTPNISPDGRHAVIAIANRDRGMSDVWIVDLESGRRRKLTVDNTDHPFAIWLPDGKSVAVTTNNPGDSGVDVVAIDGTSTRRVAPAPEFCWPMSVHGSTLLYSPEAASFPTQAAIVRLDRPDAELEPFVTGGKEDFQHQFSPDGRFVAYSSSETGRSEVFVITFPPDGGRWQVSQSGGSQPRWRGDGGELYYRNRNNEMIAVDVDLSGSGFQMGAARSLFQFHGAAGLWAYDVARDGQRFLVTAPLEADLASPVTVITDWTRLVEKR